jgi:hypothetical protein
MDAKKYAVFSGCSRLVNQQISKGYEIASSDYDTTCSLDVLNGACHHSAPI